MFMAPRPETFIQAEKLSLAQRGEGGGVSPEPSATTSALSAAAAFPTQCTKRRRSEAISWSSASMTSWKPLRFEPRNASSPTSSESRPSAREDAKCESAPIIAGTSCPWRLKRCRRKHRCRPKDSGRRNLCETSCTTSSMSPHGCRASSEFGRHSIAASWYTVSAQCPPPKRSGVGSSSSAANTAWGSAAEAGVASAAARTAAKQAERSIFTSRRIGRKVNPKILKGGGP
mmetsp:Transcript_39310/g.116484  ORF Transcript_39310/g.116484 Transcript_39310/m.116484 type:complete len:230 (+) Transcript_39310:413-1102(+)